jgi:hypothetical protein
MKTSFAYKFTTCIVHTTNEYDVTNARYVSPHFRQRFFCIPLRLNWLNKKLEGGFYFSVIQPRQPPYHATNRSLGRNCIDLSLPSLSIFSPQIECKEQSIYIRVCVCVRRERKNVYEYGRSKENAENVEGVTVLRECCTLESLYMANKKHRSMKVE